MPRLSELGAGAAGRVLEVEATGATGQRLLAMGLIPGNAFRVTAVAPMGDPITVESVGRRISLRRADAASVRVELSASPA